MDMLLEREVLLLLAFAVGKISVESPDQQDQIDKLGRPGGVPRRADLNHEFLFGRRQTIVECLDAELIFAGRQMGEGQHILSLCQCLPSLVVDAVGVGHLLHIIICECRQLQREAVVVLGQREQAGIVARLLGDGEPSRLHSRQYRLIAYEEARDMHHAFPRCAADMRRVENVDAARSANKHAAAIGRERDSTVAELIALQAIADKEALGLARAHVHEAKSVERTEPQASLTVLLHEGDAVVGQSLPHRVDERLAPVILVVAVEHVVAAYPHAVAAVDIEAVGKRSLVDTVHAEGTHPTVALEVEAGQAHRVGHEEAAAVA